MLNSQGRPTRSDVISTSDAGTFTGNNSTVTVNNTGNFNIAGGTFNVGGNAGVNFNGGTANIQGGTLNGNGNLTVQGGNLTISGGTVAILRCAHDEVVQLADESRHHERERSGKHECDPDVHDHHAEGPIQDRPLVDPSHKRG